MALGGRNRLLDFLIVLGTITLRRGGNHAIMEPGRDPSPLNPTDTNDHASHPIQPPGSPTTWSARSIAKDSFVENR
jgi:hypothetical protein